MPGRYCAVVGCSNGEHRLKQWMKKRCQLHDYNYGVGSCVCEAPFELFTFPTENNDPDSRKIWIRLVNRQNAVDGKAWKPGTNCRICSKHFIDGRPTLHHPYPQVDLGYGYCPKRYCSSPTQRPIQSTTAPSQRAILSTAAPTQWQIQPTAAPTQRQIQPTAAKRQLIDLTMKSNAMDTVTVDYAIIPQLETSSMQLDASHSETNLITDDHTYAQSTFNCRNDCRCAGCKNKDKIISKLKFRIRLLENIICRNASQKSIQRSPDPDKSLQFIKTVDNC